MIREHDPAADAKRIPPLDPLTIGISEATMLGSLTVRVIGRDVVSMSDASGEFTIETEIPATEDTVLLALESNMLMPARGRGRMSIKVRPGPEPADVDVDVPMLRAVVAQPRFKGRVIRPDDLNDPQIREAFLGQMNAINSLVLPPPPEALLSQAGTAVQETGPAGSAPRMTAEE